MPVSHTQFIIKSSQSISHHLTTSSQVVTCSISQVVSHRLVFTHYGSGLEWCFPKVFIRWFCCSNFRIAPRCWAAVLQQFLFLSPFLHTDLVAMGTCPVFLTLPFPSVVTNLLSLQHGHISVVRGASAGTAPISHCPVTPVSSFCHLLSCHSVFICLSSVLECHFHKS